MSSPFNHIFSPTSYLVKFNFSYIHYAIFSVKDTDGYGGPDPGYSVHEGGYGGHEGVYGGHEGGFNEGTYMVHTNGHHSDGASPNSSSQEY